jgi:hypothetical protein
MQSRNGVSVFTAGPNRKIAHRRRRPFLGYLQVVAARALPISFFGASVAGVWSHEMPPESRVRDCWGNGSRT